VYLTARSYLLAGFTATSIVAAISAAPNTTAHLPGIDTAQVRLSAADSEIESKMRTFRNAEVRTAAALVDRAATVVLNLSARPRAGATDGDAVPSAGPLALNAAGTDTSNSAVSTNAHHFDALARVSAAPPAASFDPSIAAALLGGVAAFNFDLLGTPFALVSALSAGGDVAISDLSNGLFQDVLSDVTTSLEFNVGTRLNKLGGDINNLTTEINKLSDAMHNRASDTPSSTLTPAQSAASPATPQTSTATSPKRTPIASLDPSAIGPLIGNAAVLALDVGAVPFETVTTLTDALSGAALDLGAGQFDEAKEFVAAQLRFNVNLVEQRLANDLKAIGANVAQLTETTPAVDADANATAGSGATTADPHATARPTTQPEQTKTSGLRGITKHTPSAPDTKSVDGASKHVDANNSTAISASSTKAPAASNRQPSSGSTRTADSPRRGGTTRPNTTPAAKTSAPNGGHKNHTTTRQSPSKAKAQHATGGKHRKK
jgi:hypothetical protein